MDAGFINRPDPVLESNHASTTATAVEAETNKDLPSVSVNPATACGDDLILRNEATAPSNDLPSQDIEGFASHGASQDLQSDDVTGRHTSAQYEEILGQPQVAANGRCSRSTSVSDSAETPDYVSPVSEATDAPTAPSAAKSLTDGEPPSVSVVSESACDDESILRNEATAEPDEPRDLESESTALDAPRSESGPNEIRVPVVAAVKEPRGDSVQVPPPESLAPAGTPSAADPSTVRAPRRCLTPEQLLHNQRVARYRAMKGLDPL